MRRTGVLAVVFAVAAAAALQTRSPLGGSALAQVPRLMEGAYEAYDGEIGANKVKPNMDVLHLLPSATGTEGKYVWENEHANYRLTAQGYQFDCMMQWTVSARSNSQFDMKTTDTAGNTHTLSLRRLGPRQNHHRKERENIWRDCKYATTRVGDRDTRRGPLLASLQAQAGERAVDGELLLTPRRDAGDKLNADDLPLWNCLLTTGLPRIELTDLPDKQATTRSFVWPDARFRADVRGEVRYEWALLATGCGSNRHVGGELPAGPRVPPAIAEKIVLACFLKDRGFEGCHQWWLTRPPQ